MTRCKVVVITANLLNDLKRENKERERRLMTADKKLMTDMVGYMKSCKYNEYDVEIVRREAIRAALKGYNHKKDLSTVTGGDYKAYCDRMCANKRKMSLKELVLSRGQTFLIAILLLYIVRLIDLVYAGESFLKHPVDITAGYLTAAASILLGTLFLYMYLSHVMQSKTKRMTTLQTAVLCLIMILIIALAYTGVYFLSDIHVIDVIWWIPLVILGILIILFRFIYINLLNRLAKEA